MNRISPVLLVSLATAVQPAVAQAPQPVRTIELSNDDYMEGTVHLANKNTVVWTSNYADNSARLFAISEKGQTAWDAKVVRAKHSYAYKAWLTAWGNRLVLVEPVERDNEKLKLKAHQLLVQVVDESGKVSRNTIEEPKVDKNIERTIFANFIENDTYYLVAEHRNHREVTEDFFLEQYNLITKDIQRIKLELPVRYSKKEDRGRFTDWVFGGHVANRSFFYRYAGVPGQPSGYKDAEGQEFEVISFDNAGHVVNRFTTALHKQLSPNTFSYYSGNFPHYSEQGHTPFDMSKSSLDRNGNTGYTTSDLYNESMGIVGDFYLEPSTGECWFLGEYAKKQFAGLRDFLAFTDGTYLQRYSAEGRLLSAVQAPYPPNTEKDLREPKPNTVRQVSFLQSPANGALILQFARPKAKQLLFANYDAQGKLQTTGTWPDAETKDLGTQLFLTTAHYSTWEGSGASQMSLEALLATEKGEGIVRRINPLAKQASSEKGVPDKLYLTSFTKETGTVLRYHFEPKRKTIKVYVF